MKPCSLPLTIFMVLFSIVLQPVSAVELALVSTVSVETVTQAPLGKTVLSDRRQFESLAEAVLFYLALGQNRRWIPIPDGPLLMPGDSHAHVAQMRRILSLYGDLKNEPSELIQGSAQAEYFDPELAQSLVAFQQRHGVTPDGILGPKARRVLNISPRQRALQLAMNFDRQQTFTGRYRDRYIQVNIPEYRLRLMEQGQEVLAMKTIIGRKSRPTPVLESQIQSLILNPAWNVPRGIAYRDIIPKWQQDQDYLQKHNLKVVSGWGTSREVLPEADVDVGQLYRGQSFLRFWQPPGETNALGRVKFMFPNRQTIYLHDTPTRKLFNEEERAFSSGCIRLEKPLLLAHQLMNQSGIAPVQLTEQVLATKRTTRIRLSDPIPLYLTYWTAWLDAENTLHFGEDIYRRDRPELAQKLR